MRKLALLVLLAASLPAVAAPFRYVSDELKIMMRTGQGNRYQIIQTLPSGLRLEVLEDAGEYTRVRTPAGKEGWVLTRFLSAQPVARQRLAAAQQKLDAIREENKSLREQLSTLQSDKKAVEQERNQLSQRSAKLDKEVGHLQKVAAKPMQIAAENSQLKERVDSLESEVDRLVKANSSLKENSQRDWFLTGAGVLGGGILLGLILPALRRKKAGGWDLR